MAGNLFSLGRRGNSSNEEEDQPTEIPPPESIFWYNKNDSYRGGFELYNQQHQQQFFPQPQPLSLFHQQQQQQDLYSSAAALGVGPSRVSDEGPSSRSGGGMSCQDCGNQAKKDCPHVRCRTCCKSRGFHCQTHLKSTWVPAAKRRERQQQLQGGDERHGDRNQTSNSSSLACTRLPLNPSPTAGLGVVNFPAMVNSDAEFRCVRVSSVDETEEEEYAYSTEVNIGGHVFKGILYDYGPDGNNYNRNNSSTSVEGAFNLTSAAPTATATASVGVGAIVDPSSLYPAPLNTFMPPNLLGGTQFFPHPRS